MALQKIVAGNISNASDVSQLTLLLNGVTTNTPILVSNRISASATGATAVVSYVGGTFAPGDENQSTDISQPTSDAKPVAPVTGANTYAKGDWCIDAAGVIWVATAATSAGLTPWVTIGTADDFARTRQYIRSTGSSWPGSDELYGHWQYGGIQYNDWSGPDALFGFTIPTSGYYEFSSSMHAKNTSSSSSFTYGWAAAPAGANFRSRGDGAYGDTNYLITLGDTVQGGADFHGNAAGFVDDIRYFNAGDHLAPYTLYAGPSSTQGVTDGTASACMFMTIELLCGSISS